ncbi:hypothetical protein [Pyxidicoccus parkwayensis]|uniref:hypothetical protein n=1 Tax=Pyxidicoccus parkwayensis TaxID=2813578 RepID=UPI001F5080F6|nr:hypothetical protein [Pyxidicoccus parkwaysis]
MTFWSNVLQDTLLVSVVAVMFCMIVLAHAAAALRGRMLMGAVQALESQLKALLTGARAEPTGRVEARALWRAIREQLVFPPGSQKVPGPVLIRTSPSRELRETCRALFRHSFGQGLGRNLTGLALVMTFGLLGYTLVMPVQEALRSSSTAGSASQADLLSQAIGGMGAKFFVSAVGLAGSFLFQAFSSLMERRLLARLDAMRVLFEQETRTLDAHEVLKADARGDALGALRAELVQTREELCSQLEKLESVNVSLQEIGGDVKTHLGTMMKEHVGDVLTRQLTAVEVTAREIAENLQRTIATGFATTLQQEMSTVREHLEGIQKALSERQEHDLGRILEQLRDFVSGGFHSQSQDMARQLEQLTAVFPRLESQFDSLSRSLGENARQWGSENQRAIDTLAEKVTSMVGSFDQVRSDLEAATARVLKASTESSHRLNSENQQVLGQLSGTVSEVVGRFEEVLAGMNGSTKALMQAAASSAQNLQDHTVRQSESLGDHVKALQAAANVGMQDLNVRSEAFSRSMQQTQDGLLGLTKQLQEAAAQLVSATKGVSATQDGASKVTTQMVQVADSFNKAASAFQQQSAGRLAVVEDERRLLTAQKEALDRVDPLLSGLVRTYEESVKSQVQYLSSQWMQVMNKLTSVSETASGELAQGVDELSDVVKELKDALKQQARRT